MPVAEQRPFLVLPGRLTPICLYFGMQATYPLFLPPMYFHLLSVCQKFIEILCQLGDGLLPIFLFVLTGLFPLKLAWDQSGLL